MGVQYLLCGGIVLQAGTGNVVDGENKLGSLHSVKVNSKSLYSS